jgi:hypothetical protein
MTDQKMSGRLRDAINELASACERVSDSWGNYAAVADAWDDVNAEIAEVALVVAAKEDAETAHAKTSAELADVRVNLRLSEGELHRRNASLDDARDELAEARAEVETARNWEKHNLSRAVDAENSSLRFERYCKRYKEERDTAIRERDQAQRDAVFLHALSVIRPDVDTPSGVGITSRIATYREAQNDEPGHPK